MPRKYNRDLTPYSKELRKNMTPEEKHLWYDFLKLLPTTVNRQKVFGSYIVDFYIHTAKLVIEVDGIQHHSSENQRKDEARDAYLSELGITVLRYDNETVRKKFEYVCQDILARLGFDFSALRYPHPPQAGPLPPGEG